MKKKKSFILMLVFLLITSASLSFGTYKVKAVTQFNVTNSYPVNNGSKAPIIGFIAFQFNSAVNIDSTKDILGDCTIKNYIVKQETTDNVLMLYYNNLNYNTNYTVKLNAAALKDSNGVQLSGDYNLTFTTGAEYERLSGPSRYETSVEIAKFGGNHADYVVLATGEDFPDALCAVPLATKYGAPILLTNKNELPSAVQSEITSLNPKEIFIVGGIGVISDNVKNVLQSQGIKVTRISGNDRYETSLAIAQNVNGPTNSEAFIVTGNDYPDALSIASYAGNKHIPILLTDKNQLPTSVKNYISSEGITKTYVIGGPGVVSDNVLSTLPNADRVAGNNRYETNMEVLSNFPFFYGETYFATGQSFADALSGAALAGTLNNPIILVDSSMPDDVASAIRNNKDIMKMKRILGGTGAVPDSIINRILK
ncbi:cell wall-binding repeat-containing protein [Clostridium sp. 'White wine YQ']|uniref:cell wall-binding repeat-containing protein n=1 Tax=Clostridium sp. 'White wine YQ' TaxID=3027474 RepID=UPI002365AB7C|nr:cell wall-binding repeat-containing protein [Clostridium sp. 'White wine YQ']MDD7795500.1 cell wall-binding repeat-containing protein [Clostridium sp. 'White wine YQ']